MVNVRIGDDAPEIHPSHPTQAFLLPQFCDLLIIDKTLSMQGR
jgi:hypothetical protein